MGATIAELETALSDFDPARRKAALAELAGRLRGGEAKRAATKAEVNLHFHTFFSFNAKGWSPSRIAWESVKYGLEVAGTIDFDVLDGVQEFLDAGDVLGLKAVAGIETRVFVREYADKVLNSPKEPGISYFIGIGCVEGPKPGSEAERTLNGLRATARSRNEEMMARVNAHLGRVQISYEKDVLSLTPLGNATERHLLAAYDRRAREVFRGNQAGLVALWSEKLGASADEIRGIVDETPKFHEKLRGTLMKHGGVGYVKPDAGRFPSLESVVETIAAVGALPTYGWLDGTNDGEADIRPLLECMVAKGAVAMNIIPDRNWNLSDPAQKALKTAKLNEAVAAAGGFDLPVVVGTEMNKAGLPFVDRFDAPELRPHRDAFLNGAHVVYGHTRLARAAGCGYFSPFARGAFASRRERNAFFARVGSAPVPSAAGLEKLRAAAAKGDPQAVLAAVQAG